MPQQEREGQREFIVEDRAPELDLMLSLGQDLFELLNAHQWVGNQPPPIYGKGGMSAAEIASAEAQLGFRFPEDFTYLLSNVRDPGDVLFPWSKFDKQNYDESIAWVLGGIEFDVDRGGLWLERWGSRPSELADALEIVRSDFRSWPKLLPVSGHRFLVAEPCLSDNPVFSIMQTDIIYYGANLAHYLMCEFVDRDWTLHADKPEKRHIALWSEFATNSFAHCYANAGEVVWNIVQAARRTRRNNQDD